MRPHQRVPACSPRRLTRSREQAQAQLEEYESAISRLEGRGDLPWDLTVAGKIATRNSIPKFRPSLQQQPSGGTSGASPQTADLGLRLWVTRVQELIRHTQNRVAEVLALCAFARRGAL